ncbi:MAG: hypothetical protein WC473_03640 [Patescibacteria group bacterium]
MTNTKIYLFALVVLALVMATAGFGCKLLSSAEQEAVKPITLSYWRVWDDSDAFDAIIKDYQVQHPNITINYRKFRMEEYESYLLNALAEDRGPDIFSIPITWLPKYENKISPLPAKYQMGYIIEKGTIQKEQVVELRTKTSPTIREIKSLFFDTVSNDVIIDNRIYGLPLSLESLIMFYNKDLLNQNSIAQVPTDWSAFQDAVEKITKVSDTQKILVAGAALGMGYNINYAFDILSVLMMQAGATMADGNGYATFFKNIQQADGSGGYKTANPGQTGLQFYTDFATVGKRVYSWDASLPNSFDAFTQGKLAFFFGYNFNIPQVRAQSRVNFGVAPIPQIAGNPSKNYADYWVETVTKASAHHNESWDFLLFINDAGTNKSYPEIKKFLAKTSKPTALRDLRDSQLSNEDLYPSAYQAPSAFSWYKGKNFDAAKQAVIEMIEQYLKMSDPRQELSKIIGVAVEKINQTVTQQY